MDAEAKRKWASILIIALSLAAWLMLRPKQPDIPPITQNEDSTITVQVDPVTHDGQSTIKVIVPPGFENAPELNSK